MASAELEQTTAEIEVKGRDGKTYGLRATGSVVVFDGFLKLYKEGRDDRWRGIDKGKDDVAEDEEDTRRLPPLAAGDHLTDRGIDADQHFTQPPARYSEATLVKRLEELGIGRPSTYASTLGVLQERGYVRTDKKRLIPEDKGRLVTGFLASFFKRYVEYDFTAGLEEKLDLISDHKLAWKDVLRDFWKEFTAAVGETKELRVTDVLETLNDLLGPHIFPDKGDGSDPRGCPSCNAGRSRSRPANSAPSSAARTTPSAASRGSSPTAATVPPRRDARRKNARCRSRYGLQRRAEERAIRPLPAARRSKGSG